MENQIKRPVSVAIARTIIFLFGVVALIPHFVLVLEYTDSGPWRIFLTPFVISTVIALSCFGSYSGLVFRKSYGRWLAVGIFAVTFALLSWIWLRQTFFPRFSYSSRFYVIIALPVVMIPILCLIHRLVFGKRVAEYFNQTHNEFPFQEPPPPPLFDL